MERSQKKSLDFSYSLSFLDKLNSLLVPGSAAEKIVHCDGYNFWQSYQELIFEEIRRFSAEKKYTPEPPLSFISALKNTFMGAIVVALSLLGIFALVFSRRRVLIYSVDSATSAFQGDFRIEPLYRALEQRNFSYSEIFHAVPNRTLLTRYLHRLRFGWYLEVTDIFFFLTRFFRENESREIRDFLRTVDYSSFATDDERAFAKHLLEKFLGRVAPSHFRINFFEAVFAWSNVKLFFAIDDTRHYHELLVALKKRKIQSFVLQHGHYTKYHAGWLRKTKFSSPSPAPDVLFVWSEYWKQELLRLGTYIPEKNIAVGGINRFPGEVVPSSDHLELVVLIPYETVAPKREVGLYIQHLLSEEGVKVFFKIRPDISPEEQLSEYGFETKHVSSRLIPIKDTSKILGEVDVVLGTYSTFLYDMLAYEKPVAIMKTSLDYGEGMVENGLAGLLDIKKGDVLREVLQLKNLSPKERASRRERVFGTKPLLLEETLSGVLRSYSF